MKDMIYKTDRDPQLIYEEITKDKYVILIYSQGQYPTAYITIPSKHKFYKNDEDLIMKVKCHGGLTFYNYLTFNDQYKHKWAIGWDYAHSTDYVCLNTDTELVDYILKKWTTKEIYQQCLEVLQQLRDMDVMVK